MFNNSSSFLRSVILGLLSAVLWIAPASVQSAVQSNVIQMAVLLDTSSSMDGLINQARTQIWKIVNELALAKKNGQKPVLEVALYEYGKDSLPSSQGYMRMILPFTTDLDKISEELFKLSTDGGSEYCGEVIQKAVNELKWVRSNDTLKIVFIAGNEPFTQGTVDFKKSCSLAANKGIIVNTIFCGNFQEGVSGQWKEGADLADGRYMSIDQDTKEPVISAPQDIEIMKLGTELNNTFISYNSAGEKKKDLQSEQDTKVRAMSPSSAVDRTVAKASKQYEAAGQSWDLVAGLSSGSVNLDKVDDAYLPAEMKKMSKEERKDYVKKMGQKREEIQKKIDHLNVDRKKYVDEELKKMNNVNTLDKAVLGAVKDQAVKKQFKFE
jgi:hypothetical protein